MRPVSLEGWFGTAIDRAVLGSAHMYQGEGAAFDPEGLASTMPAVAQVLLGHAAGRLIVRRPPDAALLVRLFTIACGLLAMGYAWQLSMRWQAGAQWTSPLPWSYQHLFANVPGDPRLGSLAYARAVLAVFSVLALWMQRRRWFVRL